MAHRDAPLPRPLLAPAALLAGLLSCGDPPPPGGAPGDEADAGQDPPASGDGAGDDDAPSADDDTSPTTGGGDGGEVGFGAPADGDTVTGRVDVRVAVPEGIDSVRLSVSGFDLGEVAVEAGEAYLAWDSGMVPDGEASLKAESPGAAPDEVAVLVENGDLVSYDVGTVENGPTGTPALVVPFQGGLLSLTFSVIGSSDTAYYLPVVRDPEGVDLVTADGDPWDDPNPALPAHSPSTAMLPNTPRISLAEGRWTVWPANDGAEGEATLRAVVKRAWEEPEAGELDLALYFVEGGRIGAASAATDSDFLGYLEAMGEILGQAGIALGERTALSMEDPEGLVVSDYGEVDRLLARTTDRGRVLNLVFVDRFDGDLEGVAGVTGGLPGPPLLHGTRYSGVVVALDTSWSWDDLAIAGAHEIGHFLGLFHTSDADGERPDPLDDTPECGSDGCSASESDNLMYPTLTGSSKLSPDQAWVMLRHPLVRLVPSPAPPPAAGRNAAPTGSGRPPRCSLRPR